MSESIKLIRHGLSVIDIADIEEESMTEAERKEYCSAIAAVWPRLEKDIKKYLHKQLLFSANQSETWDQVLVGRGAFAGMEILHQYWSSIYQEYLDRIAPQDFDKNNPINEI